jgi:hypothetical protein
MVRARILFDSSSNPSDAEDHLGGKTERGEKNRRFDLGLERERRESEASSLTIREREKLDLLVAAILSGPGFQ